MSRTATAILGLVLAGASPALGQSVQYRSPAGIAYRSLADTGAIARAEAALAADPRNIDRFIDVAVAQSAMRQFREAIETLTRGLAIAPDHAMLYRWRGHRHLSVREMDRALEDLTRGFRYDSTAKTTSSCARRWKQREAAPSHSYFGIFGFPVRSTVGSGKHVVVPYGLPD